MNYVFMKKAIRICKEMPTLSPAHDYVITMPTACKCLGVREIIVPEWCQHNLNFSFAEFLRIYLLFMSFYFFKCKISKILTFRFELQTLKFKNINWDSLNRLPYPINLKNVFLIFYNHYLSKTSELKNQVLKLRFKI